MILILGHTLAYQKTCLLGTCTQSNSPDWHLCITTSTLPFPVIIAVCLHDTVAKFIAAFIAASLTSFERLPSPDEIWHHSQSKLQMLRLSLTGVVKDGQFWAGCGSAFWGNLEVLDSCSALWLLWWVLLAYLHKPPPLFTVVKIPLLRRGPHGHTDTWCHQHCDSKSFKELDDVCYILWSDIIVQA